MYYPWHPAADLDERRTVGRYFEPPDDISFDPDGMHYHRKAKSVGFSAGACNDLCPKCQFKNEYALAGGSGELCLFVCVDFAVYAAFFAPPAISGEEAHAIGGAVADTCGYYGGLE